MTRPKCRNAYQRMMQRRYKQAHLKLRGELIETAALLEKHLALRRATPMVSWKDIADELRTDIDRLQEENVTLHSFMPMPGNCNSYQNCKDVTGKSGFNVPVYVTPTTNAGQGSCTELRVTKADSGDA
ncbi:hypothetical protein SDRG_03254 [Saprolegnia diclina VS20]|uniref:Uncharacterized protein n=1 Tax=Saprolegnia diclina (strain VS20) TaxID=1156394 RepID=T0R0H5_SAPDV|nr:hypothetical protein SDRG_03254 [Saprolegnia diclina VS20]EQC39835.1 hypothetical protein SDRG_03254 [Saprolegnia diclina VS20]|eukprot:XP_008607107.1 hypothetical protein SDRG_03254 [Saprolegnia diclina VS20]